jgi:bacterioferritin-associated ferredoxin
MIFNFKREIPGREYVSVDIEYDNDKIKSIKISALGSLQFLRYINGFRSLNEINVSKLEVPKGYLDSPDLLLFRQAVLELKKIWNPPYTQQQICHCRSVSTQQVENSILVGANTTSKVSRMTSASTACGTCMPDVQAMIHYIRHLS